jgi:TolA-binding protein
MSRHSVTESARLVNRSPRTIYKHIRSGTLSAQRSAGGSMVIDTAELIRVYGEVQEPDSDNASDGHSQAQQMQAEIDRLKALLHEREQVNELLREHNQHLTRLLEDHRPGRQRSAVGTLTEALADRIRGSSK